MSTTVQPSAPATAPDPTGKHHVDSTEPGFTADQRLAPAGAKAVDNMVDQLVAAIPDAMQQAALKTGLCTPEQATAIAADIIARLTSTGCPVFRDCTETEPGHYDHSGHGLFKVLDEKGTCTVIDAGMVALSGSDHGAVVCLGIAEFEDVEALKAKTAELRTFLDQVDALADRVFADHEGRA